MPNLSKKTRKRILRIINANCHFSDGVWVPFESSKLSTIWKFIGITQKLRNTRYGPIYGVLFDDTDYYISDDKKNVIVQTENTIFKFEKVEED